MKKKVLVVFGFMVFSALLVFSGSARSVYAAGSSLADVKKDFEAVCANSENGEHLGKEELQKLLGQCDRLKPRIEALEDTERRFYLRRLKSCRDLYQFMIESADAGKPAASAPASK